MQKLVTIWLVITSIFIGELFFYTWCRVQCVNHGYLISKAVEDQRAIKDHNNKLEIELARLKTPERIVRVAREKCGLQMPKPEQIISVK